VRGRGCEARLAVQEELGPSLLNMSRGLIIGYKFTLHVLYTRSLRPSRGKSMYGTLMCIKLHQFAQ
jgi:hypothetical protein